MIKVLLVDDMKNFLQLEASFLQRTSSHLVYAHTGVEAVKTAREARPDIIMLDIEMPEMTGIEACRIIKNDPALRHIPVVIVSAMAQRKDEAVKAGCNDFLAKPVTEEQFLKIIQKYVPIRVRQLRRVVVDFEVSVQLPGEKQPKILKTKDMSEKSVFLITDEPYLMGEEVDVAFVLPDKNKSKIATSGMVVRVVRKDNPEGALPGMAIELSGLTERQKPLLSAFVNGTNSSSY